MFIIYIVLGLIFTLATAWLNRVDFSRDWRMDKLETICMFGLLLAGWPFALLLALRLYVTRR